jgi:NSS family neurotransmitter:Na+ symporter
MMFVFAAIGSAIGLGNIWRFPYLVGKYGGGAFLLPFLLALFLVGLPLIIMEFALGQKMQKGAVGSLEKIDKRFSGIGLGAILTSFGVSCYYAVIMGWCIIYIYYSLNLGWGDDPKAFFYDNVLLANENAGAIEGFSPAVLLGLLISWILVYFCLWKGVKSVSAVIQVTIPLPVLLLLILLVRTLFLPGALDGIRFYLTPNIAALFDLDVWMAAITQVFFSLTLGFGVMISYASYQEKHSDIVKNALITCLADAVFSLIAGFVVFTTLGHMSHTSGESIEQLASEGPSLAFVVFPKALNLIPGAMFFSLIFFIMLVSLAIDSLFSLVEAIASVFEDIFPKVSKKLIVFITCLVGFIGGLVFASTAGIYYLDITDHFITNFGLVFMGLLQAICIGWFYGAEKLRLYINEVSELRIGKWWNYTIKYFIPLSLSVFLWQSFIGDILQPYGNYPNWILWAYGWGVVFFILIASAFYSYSQWKKSANKSV